MSRPLRRLGLCSFFGAPLFIGSDALYTYLISVSRAFCESSQYINRNKSNCGEGKLRYATSRFCKPRSFIARAACRPDRGKLPACQEVPERETFLRSFCFCKKNQKAGAARCPVGGGAPDAPYFILLFQKQVKCSRKGTVLFFSLLRKEPKVAQRVATLWTPGTVQNSIDYIFS